MEPMNMEKSAKIYIAGHRGLIGSALERRLRAQGHEAIITRTHEQLELTNQAAVDAFFDNQRPDYVFLAAAKVGGIHANSTYPAEFAYSNLQIQNNIVHAAWKYKVKKLCFLGSSCIYPRQAPQPMPESAFMSGPLEPTNQAYAIAKIAGIIMCQSYNKQYGSNFISVMPTNLYGPNDNYHPDNSHVLPGMIRKFHEAKVSGAPHVTLWGTGSPLREFLYSEDCAEACIVLMNTYDCGDIVNIGSGVEVSIRELAQTIREVVGFTGELRFDPSKPDGMPRKLLDCSKILSLGWKPQTPLREGIATAYKDFIHRAIS